MSEINQRVVCNGVDFQSIQNTNFKTMRISVHFMLPIDKNIFPPMLFCLRYYAAQVNSIPIIQN